MHHLSSHPIPSHHMLHHITYRHCSAHSLTHSLAHSLTHSLTQWWWWCFMDTQKHTRMHTQIQSHMCTYSGCGNADASISMSRQVRCGKKKVYSHWFPRLSATSNVASRTQITTNSHTSMTSAQIWLANCEKLSKHLPCLSDLSNSHCVDARLINSKVCTNTHTLAVYTIWTTR